MKWIVLAIVIAVVAYWLSQGRRRNSIEDPDVKTVEEKDFYLTSDDNASDNEPTSGNRNPRH
ncbi:MULTISPECIES: hypothetical protein [Marinobacter]|uniref:hypothetical protein n=1 Tax=Marinobacter TaxID=2742 RepID=UPI001D05EE18|nr:MULTISPECIES: hypothetical protein [Marinobacter]MCG8520484.1 hypothetical protein [Pseudomonadales bacterium]MCK7568193.1 hypothetical protein [Marinobacter xestospongiae]UDL06153.1 hypothetical protein J2887_05170 [Marinobacter sp. CA1]